MVTQAHDINQMGRYGSSAHTKSDGPIGSIQVSPAEHTKGTFCRGSSTVPGDEPAGDDDGAVRDREPNVCVQIAAPKPLLEAALEHAVSAAGLRVAPHGGAATVLLRTSDQPATGAQLDISVDSGHVTIAVAEPPSPDAWAAILILLRSLLDER